MKALIIASFIVAFTLSVIHMGYQWRWFRPEFVVLLLIYWCIFTPQHFGLVSAWCVSLMMDLLFLYPLGFHALGALLIAYLSLLFCQRIRNYMLWHQAVWVFILVLLFQLLCYWLDSIFSRPIDAPVFLISTFLSALLWPILVVGLQRLRVYVHLT